jgi:hypothetical protein
LQGISRPSLISGEIVSFPGGLSLKPHWTGSWHPHVQALSPSKPHSLGQGTSSRNCKKQTPHLRHPKTLALVSVGLHFQGQGKLPEKVNLASVGLKN